MSPHIGLLLRSRVLSKLQGVGKDVRSGRLELHGTTTTNVNDHAGQPGKNIEGGKEEKSCYFRFRVSGKQTAVNELETNNVYATPQIHCPSWWRRHRFRSSPELTLNLSSNLTDVINSIVSNNFNRLERLILDIAATMDPKAEEIWDLSEDGCYVALTNSSLDVNTVMDKVRSPAAGAIVVFAGMTMWRGERW